MQTVLTADSLGKPEPLDHNKEGQKKQASEEKEEAKYCFKTTHTHKNDFHTHESPRSTFRWE